MREIESGKSKMESKRQNTKPQRKETAEICRGVAMMGTPLWKRGVGPARQNGVQARGELEKEFLSG